MKFKSYVCGNWVNGSQPGRPLHNPVTGEVVAHADATGIDMGAALAFARTKGGAALSEMTFSQRGALLTEIAAVLGANREKYGEIARINSGNTVRDAAIDIDGGIGTLKYYAHLGKTLGDTKTIVEPGQDQLARDAVFFSTHLWASRPGVALQVNAYNFPAWGMWEKISVALLAGVPSIVKPATATAWLSHEMMHDVLAANIVPVGALNIVCGRGEGLVENLQPMDSLAFTGSAETGRILRSNTNILNAAPRMAIEADSINAIILGPDATSNAQVFDLAVKEIVKALSIKAGQLCTNIRRVFVPESALPDLQERIVEKLAGLKIGNPINPAVAIGPLVNTQQRDIALSGIKQLATEARVVTGGGIPADLIEADPEVGAFVAPTLLACADPQAGKIVHDLEVFGPCVTLMPYTALNQAVEMAAAGGGSLAVSLFSNDPSVIATTVVALAPWHGRVMVVDDKVGHNHTGHAIVMPQCVHGGPGRAGGGEELGGARGLRFHMQRTALQGSPILLDELRDCAVELAL